MANVVAGNATERIGACEVKHCFVLLSLSPHWIWLRPEIAVNKFGQISYEGSDWHGSALYCATENGTQWEMTFHTRANVSKMKTYVFKEVRYTTSFLSMDEDEGYNALLLPKFIE